MFLNVDVRHLFVVKEIAVRLRTQVLAQLLLSSSIAPQGQVEIPVL